MSANSSRARKTNRHETFTVLWNPYRRVSSRGRRAQIRFSRGAHGEKPENDRPPFWFYGESIRTSVFNNTATIYTTLYTTRGNVVNGAHSSESSPKAIAIVYTVCALIFAGFIFRGFAIFFCVFRVLKFAVAGCSGVEIFADIQIESVYHNSIQQLQRCEIS